MGGRVSGTGPEPSKAVVKRWDEFITRWSTDVRLPLFVRRRTAGRGTVVTHEAGRLIFPVDNTTAHWVYRAALEYRGPPAYIDFDTIPVALAFTKDKSKISKYRTQGKRVRLNSDGWKLCHVEAVGLGPGKPDSISIDRLQAHFVRLLSPSSMFVAPLCHPGIGEFREIIEAVQRRRK